MINKQLGAFSKLIFLAVLGCGLSAEAKSPITEPPAKPFGNVKAPKGGTFTINLPQEPPTLNPITGTDLYSMRIHALVMDSLLIMNPDTYDYMPGLAEKVDESNDGMVYTFTLRKDATFHDGKPVTAEDVKFSIDAIFDDKYNAAHLRPYYENIAKVEILDPHTVRFTVKEKYFRNLSTLALTTVLPKHVYGDAEKGKRMNKTIVGSGSYKVERYDQGQSLILVRHKDHWSNKLPHLKGGDNFDRIRFRFIKDENIVLESLKKRDLDFFEDLTNEAFAQKAVGPEWGKTVFKVKTENLSPKSYGFLGWNLRREIFKDREVRLALYELLNRHEINKKFRYDMSLLATGPWYQQSEYADPAVKPVLFNPKQAVERLKKAGWTDSNKDGVLDKVINGQRTDLRFTLMYANKTTEKYWILYQSDLKKAGVDLKLQHLEWNAFSKNLHDHNFDAVAMAWGAGSVLVDPKQVWHSSSAAKGGSNYTGYSNPEVDKLIDQARLENDKAKRIVLLRKVYRMIAEDHPFAFLFNDKFILYAHSDKVKKPQDTFKFAIGQGFWWHADAK